MGLNIKNERITALVRQLARRTGMTQTGAIEEAVRSKLAELEEADRGAPDSGVKQAGARQLLDELRRSLTAAERSELRAAEGELYDDAGLPA
jgi:antitoxin VapB